MIDRPIRKEGVSLYSLGKEWFLHDKNQGNVQVINGTARFIWELCDGLHTPDEIESAVKDSYEVGSGCHLAHYIKDILQNFQRLGLLDTEE